MNSGPARALAALLIACGRCGPAGRDQSPHAAAAAIHTMPFLHHEAAPAARPPPRRRTARRNVTPALPWPEDDHQADATNQPDSRYAPRYQHQALTFPHRLDQL